MAIPTSITFHDLDVSPSAEASVERWVSRLEHIDDRIIRCHAMISQPNRYSRKKEFEVHLKLDLASGEIVTQVAKAEDVYVAVADVFRGARRQLLDDLQGRRGYARAPFITRHATL